MLIEKLNWRYATKKMDPAKVVPEEKLNKILEAIQLAPTSSGLQPFHVFVLRGEEIREKIKDAAYGQTQITDGTCVLVFAAWDNYTEERIQDVVDQTIAARPGAADGVNAYFDNLRGSVLPRPAEENFQNAARQTYIALGVGLVAAAFEQVDATPMEGFDPKKVNEILDLPAKGLSVTCMMAVGYRDGDGDWLAGMKKVRRPMDELFTEV